MTVIFRRKQTLRVVAQGTLLLEREHGQTRDVLLTMSVEEAKTMWPQHRFAIDQALDKLPNNPSIRPSVG